MHLGADGPCPLFYYPYFPFNIRDMLASRSWINVEAREIRYHAFEIPIHELRPNVKATSIIYNNDLI